jgi:hypothetical protein
MMPDILKKYFFIKSETKNTTLSQQFQNQIPRQMVERGKIDTANTPIHDRWLSCLDIWI